VRGRTANPHGPLKIPCENCHSTAAWKPIRQAPEFSHDRQTTFPLRGMHQGVPCQQCHVNRVFKNVGTRCADCHADVHRRQFGANCQECHTVRGWQVAISAIQQHTNRFPLIGAHAAVPCDACHLGAASGSYIGLSTECVTCHLKDYQKASPLNHVAAQLPTTCGTCHSMDNWQGARFDHARFGHFALTGMHATLACQSCHVGGRFAGTPADCFSCHVKDFTGAQDPNHVQAGFPHDCAICHSTASWANATFNHSTTSFPLTGAHVNVQCAQCHVMGNFATTPAQCAGCHMADFDKTTNPNHRTGNIPTTCETCHNTASWQNATFNHNLSRFPLTGAHATVQCAQCHVNGQFQGIPTQCVGCHLADFQKTTNPNHVAAAFPQDCTLCHTTVTWTGATFDHSKTQFPLTGAHKTVACAQCHVGGKFAGTPTQCVSCHLADFQKVTNPNHVSAGFPQDCTMCHNTATWSGSTFNHAATGFPLTGAHATVQCAQCHVGGKFAGTPAQCVSCHLKDFQGTNNPNHVSAGFPQDCQVCHTTTTWSGATFDHSKTQFPLTGAHATVQCAQCHVNNQFSGLSTQCVGCHLADFQHTNTPNHVTAGFPQDCTLCHTTATWQGAKFDHSKTQFPLTGAHVNVQCAHCHVNNQFAGLSTQCVSCHLKDFQNTNNPNHVSAGFPQDCTLCHTTATWQGAKFDHSKTQFPLTGAHVNVQCAQCHVNNQFAGLSTQCVSCHLKDFQNTNNPNHAAAGFPQNCALCHTTASWAGATFNHNTATTFPLTGAHVNVACASCHVNNVFAGLSTACSGCHMADYNGTNNPNHKAAGFPTDCSLCHTTANWNGATFNHNNTPFPLTGAHTSVACGTCHVNNVFAGLSTACASCHMADYNGATSPNHKAAGFPTDCSLCHSTTNWDGATFNHASTGFALTGAHASLQCAQCHVNNVFTGLSAACSSCHMADYNGTNNPNHKAAGFPTDCSLCHSTTNWSGATFKHNNTPFPLTGAHTSVACTSCHVNNVFAGTPTDCYSCHKTEYQSTSDPNHIASSFPTTCATCHTTTSWSGATFNHTWFPIYSGTHAGKWTTCADCHINSSDYSVFSCITCHQHDQASTDPHHRGVRNYVYAATTCYTCHPRGTAD
jgi:hypothetical protein